MRYRQLGESGLTVSVVGVGCNAFGARIDADTTRAVVDAALDQGITLFDTADTYGLGESETLLGASLGKRRDDVVVATKFGMDMQGANGPDWGVRGSRRYIRKAVEASLRRLGTDWIDLYQMHAPDPRTPIEETLGALHELVTEGKVRYVGSSNFAAWQLTDADWVARSSGFERFISAQNKYSLYDRSAEAELVPAAEQQAPAPPGTRLFDGVTDRALKSLGVDDDTLRRARSLTDKEQLELFAPYFPPDQCEVLQYLAEGFSVEEVWRDVVAHRLPPAGAGTDEASDYDSAIRQTGSRIRLVTASEELREILDKPFAAWRVFLHPSQHRVAYRPSYSGPAQVTGGPGTGKSVVALHRVRYLLGHLREGERVLLTTYTNALVAALRDGLQQLVADEALLARVDLHTVDSFAHRVLSSAQGSQPRPLTGREEIRYWERAVAERRLDLTPEFLAQEYKHVILAQDLVDESAYLAARRPGRGSPLAAHVRSDVWRAVGTFLRAVAEDGRCTYLQRAAEAARALARRRSALPACRRRRGAGSASGPVAVAARRGGGASRRPVHRRRSAPADL
jgi:aryl-alcohol dehydrogenase-like predicted oxidoreductase